jgi:arginase
MTSDQIIRIFGIPMDLGQGRRGVDMGPSAIRYAGLHTHLKNLGYHVEDAGNIFVRQAEELPEIDPTQPDGSKAYYLPEVATICQSVYDQVVNCLQEDEYGVFLGGDHSMSIGTVAAALSVLGRDTVGVLWIDAHADINTPRTSPSGNVHGMSVAALLGDGPESLTGIGGAEVKMQPEQLAMIGLRNLDPGERVQINQRGINVYTMREIDELGVSEVARRVLNYFDRFEHIHVSLDLDSCDPSIAPGVGTPVRGGLNYREAHLLMETLADSGKVRTVDVVEVNPILDTQNTTATIAVELVASLFGQRIM